jgi:hypothetical protein
MRKLTEMLTVRVLATTPQAVSSDNVNPVIALIMPLRPETQSTPIQKVLALFAVLEVDFLSAMTMFDVSGKCCFVSISFPVRTHSASRVQHQSTPGEIKAG